MLPIVIAVDIVTCLVLGIILSVFCFYYRKSTRRGGDWGCAIRFILSVMRLTRINDDPVICNDEPDKDVSKRWRKT